MKLSLFQCVVCFLALLLVSAIGAAAQVAPIPEMPITLSGALTAGYAAGSGAALGSSSTSSNSLMLGANADLNGFYHDPRFLQFSMSPRFTWTRNGSNTAAAMHDRDNGFNFDLNLLQSSDTPIHFSYQLTQVNTASLSGGPTPFTVGAGGLSRSFSIGAAHRFKDLPSLNVNYSRSTSDTDVIGANAPKNHTNHDFLNVFSNYRLAGFNMNGSYTHSTSDSQMQDLLQLGIPALPSSSSSDSESIGISHSLPLNGGASVTASHSDNRYEFNSTPQTGSYDTLGSSVSLQPLRRLNTSVGASYTSNVAQEVISDVAGGGPIQNVFGDGRALMLDTNANYQIGHGFSLTATGSQQNTDFSGQQLNQSVVIGTLYYTRRLWGGTLYASYGPGWNSADFDAGTTHFSTSGLYHVGTAGYQHQVGRWSTQGSFSYTRNSATLGDIAPVLAHSLSITGRARTRIRYNWNLSLGALLGSSQAAGRNSNGNQLFSAQIGNRTWSFNGQWQRNSGYFLSSASGIIGIDPTATPPPGLVPFYNTSKGITLGGSYTRRRLTLTGSYSRSTGMFDTLTVPATTTNSFLEARAYYRFRLLDFQGGVRRLTQAASSNGALDSISNAYWISVVRQFRAF